MASLVLCILTFHELVQKSDKVLFKSMPILLTIFLLKAKIFRYILRKAGQLFKLPYYNTITFSPLFWSFVIQCYVVILPSSTSFDN